MEKSWRINRKEFKRGRSELIELDPISAHFQAHLGPLLPVDTICLSEKSEIWVNRCAVAGQPVHVLFTVGLCQLGGVELYLVLPADPLPWPVRRFMGHVGIEESFPVDLLRAVVKMLERKNARLRLEAGTAFPRSQPGLSKLRWDAGGEGVRGLVVVDRPWGPAPARSVIDHGEEVHLMALLPYSAVAEPGLRIKRGRATEGLEAFRSAAWGTVGLPFNPAIFLQQALEDAIEARDPARIEKAVRDGADVNRPMIRSHSSFGFYQGDPILIEAMDLADESLIRSLVDLGASVPGDIIASLGRWGSRSLVEFLMEHGADINAVSVTMTGLQRAKAFKNHELVAVLKALGAR